MKKNVLIIFGFSIGIALILWIASVLKIVHIPDVILFIQLITHFLITLILYSFFILIVPKYKTHSFVKKTTSNQVVFYGLIALFVSIVHSFIYHFIYDSIPQLNEDNFKVFIITFLTQISVFFVASIGSNNQRNPLTVGVTDTTESNFISNTDDIVHIQGQLPKEKISFHTNELLFIKSSDNYSEFYFLHHKSIERKILRLTLKSIEEQLGCEHIIRSHKSYIVNLKQDIEMKGNANDTKIFVENFTIPVSRSRRNTILELYAKYYS